MDYLSDIPIASGAVSNYEGMSALVGQDGRVYLGKSENCYLSREGDAPAYYDNSDGLIPEQMLQVLLFYLC